MDKTEAITRQRSEWVERSGAVAAVDVEAIARRVVEMLGDRLIVGLANGPDLVDAAELARRLGTRRSWIYSHAAELGAIRLGAGPRPRLRFDASVAMERVRVVGRIGERPPAPTRLRRLKPDGLDARLLPVKRGGAS